MGNVQWKKCQDYKFFFSLDKNKPSIYGVVNTLKVNNNQIIINLKSDKKYSAITWLPNKEYLNTKDIYNGPWIKGVYNKIGSLSFDNGELIGRQGIEKSYEKKLLFNL